jgi:hypothetical protein
MSDDLVKRLRRINQHYDLARGVHQDIRAAADCIEELEAKLTKAVEALRVSIDVMEWVGGENNCSRGIGAAEAALAEIEKKNNE